MHRMQSGGWLYSKVSRDPLNTLAYRHTCIYTLHNTKVSIPPLSLQHIFLALVQQCFALTDNIWDREGGMEKRGEKEERG